jgi:uncharacterized protein (TIGR02646 family)
MPKTEVPKCLLQEQGYLCAYTMLRISDPAKGHIEHIVPQSHKAKPELQIAYRNMLYCYPGQSVSQPDFGARKKDGAVMESNDFVSPLDSTCESRFVYKNDGTIAPANEGDSAAVKTIEILNLQSRELTQARMVAILALPIFKRSSVAARHARKAALEILQRDSDGCFRVFAVALCQALTRYAEKRAAKEAVLGPR